jgi:3-oxoacyl-[acyl-carrier protein] reductase
VVAQIVADGGKAFAVQADVAKAADVQGLFDATKKNFGALDVLVNNAGVYAFSPVEAFEEQDFHRHFNTNVLGVFLTTKESLAHFGAAGGSIINVSSVVTRLAPPASSVYTASKAAVEALTQVQAKELGPKHIRVNAIAPGGVETEGTHTAGIVGSDFATQLVAQTPLGRFGQPNDIATVALFLASSDSAWMTGETLIASGGLR